MWEHRGVKDELCYKNSYKSSQKKKNIWVGKKGAGEWQA